MTTFAPEHAAVWFEIPVGDLARAKAFYGPVLGTPPPAEDWGGTPTPRRHRGRRPTARGRTACRRSD